MAKADLEFGIQECSKCRYKMKCDECIYNKKSYEEVTKEIRKETAEKILKPLYEACKEDSYGQVVVDFSILEDFARKYGVDLGEEK